MLTKDYVLWLGLIGRTEFTILNEVLALFFLHLRKTFNLSLYCVYFVEFN